MSKEKLAKTVEELCRTQQEICARLERLEQRVAAGPPASRDEVVAFLDRFSVTEGFGESLIAAWLQVCQTDCVRGALRTVQLREGSHARLAAERLKELGGSSSYEIPEKLHEQAFRSLGGTELSDLQKLELFTAQFPDLDAATREIRELADRLDGDRETQALLRTMEQDERASIGFLTQTCQQLKAAAA